MKPEENMRLAQMIGDLIEDPPVGEPLVVSREGGANTILFQGRKGIYDIADLPEGRLVMHIDEASHAVKGIYNFTPADADLNAAALITQIIDGLSDLRFQVGYLSTSESETNWKRYSAGEGQVIFKSREILDSRGQRLYVQAEIILEGFIVSLRHFADGHIDQIHQIPSSQL